MKSIKQCTKCNEVKDLREFGATNGKRNNECNECLTADADITIIPDEYEFTEESFTDDEAEKTD